MKTLSLQVLQVKTGSLLAEFLLGIFSKCPYLEEHQNSQMHDADLGDGTTRLATWV